MQDEDARMEAIKKLGQVIERIASPPPTTVTVTVASGDEEAQEELPEGSHLRHAQADHRRRPERGEHTPAESAFNIVVSHRIQKLLSGWRGAGWERTLPQTS